MQAQVASVFRAASGVTDMLLSRICPSPPARRLSPIR